LVSVGGRSIRINQKSIPIRAHIPAKIQFVCHQKKDIYTNMQKQKNRRKPRYLDKHEDCASNPNSSNEHAENGIVVH